MEDAEDFGQRYALRCFHVAHLSGFLVCTSIGRNMLWFRCVVVNSFYSAELSFNGV